MNRPAATATPASRRPKKSASSAEKGVGSALRSVYDEAMEEAIPKEMLDLLGKLG